MSGGKMTELRPVFVETIDEPMEHGVLYVSEKYGLAIHLCACGCGEKTVTPFHPTTGWVYTREGDIVTLSPSIGNWQMPCRSHYFVVRNQVQWC